MWAQIPQVTLPRACPYMTLAVEKTNFDFDSFQCTNSYSPCMIFSLLLGVIGIINDHFYGDQPTKPYCQKQPAEIKCQKK